MPFFSIFKEEMSISLFLNISKYSVGKSPPTIEIIALLILNNEAETLICVAAPPSIFSTLSLGVSIESNATVPTTVSYTHLTLPTNREV